MKTFLELHDEGVALFGYQWFLVNQVITETAQDYGLDVSEYKQVLSAIALSLCKHEELWKREQKEEGD